MLSNEYLVGSFEYLIDEAVSHVFFLHDYDVVHDVSVDAVFIVRAVGEVSGQKLFRVLDQTVSCIEV